ncbi:MFS general substrate transporter [Linderina pennispora]|uniref:MFS general substrate transporter n=1 Tax=Linderina pennispora TaxID=61395 RepID=A0A1Y1WM28_9FUNG|nr:MFS general substrate transporter [Linderina pennispora]ORX74144.1 MFS general substrate transporter [Linderina pennispora]
MSFLTFITSIDTTIVGTAYIPIGSHFNGADRAEWIINSYLIAVAAFQPIYGKVSDIIGRVEAITIAITIFMLGSVISGVSTSLNMLIAGRVVQGIGGAGFMNMSRIVLGDISSKQDRGKYFSAITCAYGVGIALGPVIGGLIVEYSKWQVIFWINIPICVVVAAVVNIILKLPRPDGTWKEKVKAHRLWGLAVVNRPGIVLVLLALSVGRTRVQVVINCRHLQLCLLGSWSSWCLSSMSGRLHRYLLCRYICSGIWNVSVSSISQIFQAAGFYGPVTFIPQWALLSRHASSITSGLYLLPFAITTIFATVGSGVLNSRTGTLS